MNRNELAKTGQGTTGVGAAATVGDRMQHQTTENLYFLSSHGLSVWTNIL